MWYKCEVMGQSNQVHQLKLLQKIISYKKRSEFCEYMSKSKNAKSCNVNHIPLTKMSHFSEFLSWIMQNTRKGWTRDQNIDSYEEISFLGKIYSSYHLVSPLACRGPWMSNVVICCWCHIDSASVLLYFTLSKTKTKFWKILIFTTHGLMTKFNSCSKFQTDRINILGDVRS